MFPYEIKLVDDETDKQVREDFKGERVGLVQVGPKKWCYPKTYIKYAEKFYNYPVRSDDIWLVTFPRSGTTLTQELVWLLNNNLDYEKASQSSLFERFPFFEYSILYSDMLVEYIEEKNIDNPKGLEKLAKLSTPVCDWDLPPPRHIKTHLPFSLIPPDVGVKCKAIYVARHPKDSAVSYYYLNRKTIIRDFKGDFNKFWKYFTDGLVVFSPYWDHIQEGWERKENKNVLFLFYEDFIRDPKSYIKKVANFLDKKISEEDLGKLANHLHFDNFRKNIKLVEHHIKGMDNEGEQQFIRRGKVGGNKEFDEELNAAANQWFEENRKKIGIIFPVDV